MAIIAIGTFIISLLAVGTLRSVQFRWNVVDYPNERSLHSVPIPRTGGLGILVSVVAGSIVVWMLSGEIISPVVWIAVAILAIVSFLDDRLDVHVLLRLVTHFIVATMLVFAIPATNISVLPGVMIGSSWLVLVAITFFAVWIINLYNFMDGVDGLAGGMALIGFGTFAILGWSDGNELFASLNIVIVAAVAGFLVFNFPPAKIFMGDVGSSTLGFFAATMSLWGERDGIFPLWIAILVFSPFIVDATVTLVKRIVRRERVWHAHKTHYYQRLVQSGCGHKKTVIAEYITMVAAAISAIIGAQLQQQYQWVLIAVWVVIYISLGQAVNHIEKGYEDVVKDN